MPLSPDASLFVPYTVWQVPGGPGEHDRFVAVQKQDDDIIFMSSVAWPTLEEAERHAHDLNWLREETLSRMTTTNIWLSVDVISDGPDALVLLEKAFGTDPRIAGWRLLNPAADEDHNAWQAARAAVLAAVESIAQEDLPFEDGESLVEHLQKHHDFDFNDVPEQPDTWYVRMHRELHDRGFDNATHTHEWNDEEVEPNGDEEEGAHEDTDS